MYVMYPLFLLLIYRTCDNEIKYAWLKHAIQFADSLIVKKYQEVHELDKIQET